MSHTAAAACSGARSKIQRRDCLSCRRWWIDQQIGAPAPPAPSPPSRRPTICAFDQWLQRARQHRGLVGMAIEDMRFWPRPSTSSARTAPRAAPPAPSSTTVLPSSSPIASRRRFRKAHRVGVAAFDPAIGMKDQKIGRARRLGRGIAVMRQGEGRFLVRHRDIDAAKPGLRRLIDHAWRNPRGRTASGTSAPSMLHVRSANSHAAPATANARSASRSRPRSLPAPVSVMTPAILAPASAARTGSSGSPRMEK